MIIYYICKTCKNHLRTIVYYLTVKQQMWSLLIENGRKGSEIRESYLLRSAQPTSAEKSARTCAQMPFSGSSQPPVRIYASKSA